MKIPPIVSKARVVSVLRTFSVVGTLALAGATVVACASEDNSTEASGVSSENTAVAEGFPVEVEFAPETPVTIENRPERIVSLSPTVTEMLFAVGAGEQVVAVDEYSNYPEEAPVEAGLSGYTPNVESVLNYDPDLVVLMTKADGIVNGLNAAGVPVIVVPAATEIDDTYEQIAELGAAVGRSSEAEMVTAEMQSDIETAVASVPEEIKNAGLSYYHELTSDHYSVSSSTFIGQVYALFGLTSIAPDNDAYPQLNSEAIIAANPDLIFLGNSNAEGTSLESVSSRPGWHTIDAVNRGLVITLDDDLASRWGPRVSELVEQIAAELTERVSGDAEQSVAVAA